MSEHQARFQALLRELFQFDSADLDFGIYRIMNHKRDAIERYIAEDLPRLIEDELSQGALLEQALVAEQLGRVQEDVVEKLGPKPSTATATSSKPSTRRRWASATSA